MLIDMRVIGGELRSRRLVAPHGMGTRPTSDRLRETLFNVLTPHLAEAHFLDLYAGSGAVGIEALSRGATACCFVERAPTALTALRANLTTLALRERAAVEAQPVSRALSALLKRELRFDLVFLDPPYEAAAEYAASLHALGSTATGLLAPTALVVAEHARRTLLAMTFGSLRRTRVLEQGDAALSFYTAAPEVPLAPAERR